MMKSLRRIGLLTSGRAIRISRKEPPKYFSSVRMEIAEAPAASYAAGICSASAASYIHPLDGERRLNSAIMPVVEAASAFFILRRGEFSFIRTSTCARKCSDEIACFCISTSIRLCFIISDNISFIALMFL